MKWIVLNIAVIAMTISLLDFGQFMPETNASQWVSGIEASQVTERLQGQLANEDFNWAECRKEIEALVGTENWIANLSKETLTEVKNRCFDPTASTEAVGHT